MKVYTKFHPFQQRTDSVYFSPYRSVGALSATLAPRFPTHRIYLNDEVVQREDYDRLIREEDVVVVCGVPGEGFTLTAFLISLAVSVSLSAVTVGLTYLLRPKQPKLIGPEAQRNSITGAGNQVDPYGAIPTICGKIRMFPRFPGKFPTQYTEIVGNDQYLRFFMLVAKGPVTLPRSSIRIGSTDVTKLQDVELEILEGKAGDPALTLYPASIQETALNVGLTAAASWQTQTTAADVDHISVDWSFLRGLQKSTKNGGMDARTVDVQIEYKLTTEPTVWSGFGTYKVLNHVLLASYPVAPLPGTIRIKSDGADTRTVTFTGLDAAGSPISENIVLNNTTLVEGALTFSKIIDATLSAYDSNRIVRVFVDDEPATTGGGHIHLVAVAVLGAIFRTVGKTRSILRRNHTWDVPTGTYDVRMRRLTADSNDLRVLDEAHWTAIRSIKDGAPYSEPNAAIIAGRIRATDQLNGQIDNLSCVPEAECQIWNGSAWSAATVTRNPAWNAVNVLTGPNNKRPVSLSLINGDSFKDFADWCDTKGFECNHVFDGDSNVEDTVQQILAAGRGSLDFVDGKYVVVIDQQQTDIMGVFTPRNSWGFEGHAKFPEEVHGLRIGFLNEDEDYSEDERVVFYDGYNAGNATKYDFLEYQGVTNDDQAWKLGRYEIADRLLQFERFSFHTDFEHLRCTRGDLVLASHDAMLVGIGWGLTTKHEYAPTGGHAVTIDADVILDPTKTYGVQIRKVSDGTVLESQIVNTGNTTRRLEFIAPLPGLDTTLGNLVTVGIWGEISQRCIVKGIEPIEDNGYLAARLTVAVEAPGRYTADESAIPPHTPIITLTAHPLNLQPPEPSIRTIRSSEDASTIQDSGSYAVKMVVLVDFPTGFNPASVFIQAQYRPYIAADDWPNPHPWVQTPMEEGTKGEITIADVDVILVYEVRVRSLNKLNPSLISPWSAITQHTVLGDTIAPDPPTSFAAAVGDRFVTLSWVNPTDDALGTLIDFEVVEIWRSTADDILASPTNAVYVGETAGEKFIDSGLTNETTYYYWARARDFAGNVSGWHSASESPANAGLSATPTANVVVSKAEARLASDTLQSLDTFLTLNYTAQGGKIRVRAKMFIYSDGAANSPPGQADITLLHNGSFDLDNYTIDFTRIGVGYPGEISLAFDHQPAAGSQTYSLVYAGSSETANALNIGIFVEEVET